MSHITRRRNAQTGDDGWGEVEEEGFTAKLIGFFLSLHRVGRGSDSVEVSESHSEHSREKKKEKKNFAGDPHTRSLGTIEPAKAKRSSHEQDVDHAITEKKSKSHFRNWKWEINFV